ncbi:MAG: family 16 glycosylhydrolase [Bacteroidales bacterium]
MATTPSSFKVFTNRLFGTFKDTETVESARKALETEYEEILSYSQSDEWYRYLELKSWVDSKEYLKVKQELGAITFKNSPEFEAEQELKKLSGNSALKNYLKMAKTEMPAFFSKIKDSGLVEELNDLRNFVGSADYKKNRKAFKKENTPEYQKELRFKELKSSADLKKYFKLVRFKPLKDYFGIENSQTLQRHSELKASVESPGFAERKNYLLSKNKFEQTDSYKKLQEFKALESSEKVKWYLKTKDSHKFDDIKSWTLIFHDDFDGKSLDAQRWLTKFFWGDAVINKSYSFSTDRQFYSESGNLELKNSVLRIETRKENASGLAWDKKFGFIPKSFNFTSGVINTGHIYRQSEGRIEAKVKLSCAKGINHSFYLIGDRMLPELDVFLKADCGENSISGAYFWANGSSKVRKSVNAAKGVKINSEFYILGVEWNEQNIVWTINGTPYKLQANKNPNIPLYLVFASGVCGDVDESRLPAYMEIDWVKCWKKA